eukprot:NODE_733_length_1389_cov_239.461019.p1 GENE.NODE_733_length_1389_cov_239.461019~~NODE_733_length_1389_cov_239.461019.p1  ORF type:complete len:402 (+),score=110.70 NODE_733_length_1389_cov_239.461019:113-1207(+)
MAALEFLARVQAQAGGLQLLVARPRAAAASAQTVACGYVELVQTRAGEYVLLGRSGARACAGHADSLARGCVELIVLKSGEVLALARLRLTSVGEAVPASLVGHALVQASEQLLVARMGAAAMAGSTETFVHCYGELARTKGAQLALLVQLYAHTLRSSSARATVLRLLGRAGAAAPEAASNAAECAGGSADELADELADIGVRAMDGIPNEATDASNTAEHVSVNDLADSFSTAQEGVTADRAELLGRFMAVLRADSVEVAARGYAELAKAKKDEVVASVKSKASSCGDSAQDVVSRARVGTVRVIDVAHGGTSKVAAASSSVVGGVASIAGAALGAMPAILTLGLVGAAAAGNGDSVSAADN